MNPDEPKFKLTTVFEPAPEGGFTCHFEELPEIFSEGETMDEARANLWDALEQVMAYHREEARKHTVPGAVREELQLAAS
ncbi:MAG TPA: type II toxin-antitoxin system HicB family antitoxin [Verrucomicrobiae bacterium]|nr:type II toxin-antitoxin system HicB family antitoxin [Verrucomicrobiae bacterium]